MGSSPPPPPPPGGLATKVSAPASTWQGLHENMKHSAEFSNMRADSICPHGTFALMGVELNDLDTILWLSMRAAKLRPAYFIKDIHPCHLYHSKQQTCSKELHGKLHLLQLAALKTWATLTESLSQMQQQIDCNHMQASTEVQESPNRRSTHASDQPVQP